MTLLQDLWQLSASWSDPARLALVAILKSTLFLAVAVAAAAAIPRRSAATRHLVLAAGLLGALLVPFGGAVLPPVDLPLLPAAEATAERSTPSETLPPPVDAWSSRAVGEARRSSSEVQPLATSSGPPGSRSFSPEAIALLAVGGVGSSLLLYLVAGIAVVGRMSRRSEDWTGSEAVAILDELREDLGIRRPVTLGLSDRVRVPLTLGALRPRILLPTDAIRWPQADLRSVLLHELGHVKRWDWATQIAARLACSLHWFNPLAWAATSRLLVEAERACDDIVMSRGSEAPAYARQLLEMATLRRRELPVFGAVAMARRATLSARIEAILDPSRRRSGPGPRLLLTVGAVSILLFTVLGPARLVRAADSPGERSPAEQSRGESWRSADEGASPTFVPVPDVDARYSYDEAPPLLRAVARGDLETARRLLDGGANPDRGETNLGTPLIVAAALGNEDLTRLLLERGASADLSQMIRRGWPQLARSPLGAAASGGNPRVVDLLLEAGAPVDFAPEGDAPPLAIAAENGHGEIVERLLLAGADPNRVVEGDGTPLIAAVRAGDRRIVERLLDAGAEPDRWVDGDECPLYHAVDSGRRDLARILLEAGADPTRPWPGDGNALGVAGENGDRKMLELLLEYARETPLPWTDDDWQDRDSDRETSNDPDADASSEWDTDTDDSDEDETGAWLVADGEGRRLFVTEGSVIEFVGSGALEFPVGDVTVSIPRDHRILVDGEPLGGQMVLTGSSLVEIVSADGDDHWRLRAVSPRVLDGPGTRIEEDEGSRGARIDSSGRPMRFYYAVDERGRELFFEPKA